eukprot:CAMPEP_0172701424 /NCGR_PEP_ID=MMETSP1074-20121228/31625_1 /TAXON_ID=2916 /ORGANISM="Ceratium fusus, Strain PA161109" /LENGTH=43 /DNA_ID= /DNA_START= /DNA_END= /DNA_ORIENTATION=
MSSGEAWSPKKQSLAAVRSTFGGVELERITLLLEGAKGTGAVW